MQLKADIKFLEPVVNYKKPILALLLVSALIALSVVYFQVRGQRIIEDQKKAYSSGVEAYSSGKFDQAIKDLEEAKRLNPKDAKTHVNLAQSYEAKGKLDKALEEYEASLKVNPNQPETLYNLAIIYKSREDLDKAIKLLEKAVKINGDFVAARITLGDLYALNGANDKAKEQYQTVVKMNPFGVDIEAIKNRLKQLGDG